LSSFLGTSTILFVIHCFVLVLISKPLFVDPLPLHAIGYHFMLGPLLPPNHV
jgi:hypothetical protein